MNTIQEVSNKENFSDERHNSKISINSNSQEQSTPLERTSLNNKNSFYENDIFDHEKNLKDIKEKWNPLLVEGAKKNNVDNILLALKNGAVLFSKDRNKWDSLCWAANNGNLQIVQILVDKGVLEESEYCKTFENSIKKLKKENIVKGSLIESPDLSPLQLATIKGHYKVVAYLLKQGLEREVIDKFGNSIYHLAAASNDLSTFEVFMQMGVNFNRFNCRGHYPKNLSTNLKIKGYIDKYFETEKCTLTNKVFSDEDVKYWCLFCKNFFDTNACEISFELYEETDLEKFRPECLCLDCLKEKKEYMHKLEEAVAKKNYNTLKELSEKVKTMNIPLDVKTISWLEYENQKLFFQKDIKEKIQNLKEVENFKTIKKSIAELETKLMNANIQKLQLDQELILDVKQEIKRLNAERNLRFFLENFKEYSSINSEKIEISEKFKEKEGLGNFKKIIKRKVVKKQTKPVKKPVRKPKSQKIEEEKVIDPFEEIKNMTFDITIEDIEREENKPKQLQTYEIQPLISELSMLLSVSDEHNVNSKYILKGEKVKELLETKMKYQDILNKFEQYPEREYPLDPIMDPRTKRLIHPITKKPIDPNKPYILPLNVPKKKKRKKKKDEIKFPEWADDFKVFSHHIEELEDLLKNPNVLLDSLDEAQKIKSIIKRMYQEKNFRVRIQKDLKIIQEINSKKPQKKN